jgi:hypothetical protein
MAAGRLLGTPQWEWIATARLLARHRESMAALEESLETHLARADPAMVNALSGGFRVAQTQLAVAQALPDPKAAAAALESAQIVALAVLVREELDAAAFSALYRPFATVLPGPDYVPPAHAEQQAASFVDRLPSLAGALETEVAAVAKALDERAPASATSPGLPDVTKSAGLDPAANYAAAWKQVLAAAQQIGRTEMLRTVQQAAEQAAPHDGLGIVGFAGVAACAVFMRESIPIEKVLLLFEPFAGAIPYESLG